MTRKRKPDDIPQPWDPPAADEQDIRAMKALASGKASEGQQRVALQWIINRAAGTYDQPFRPGGEDGRRATDFAAGKMHVGQRIVNLINMAMPEAKTG